MFAFRLFQVLVLVVLGYGVGQALGYTMSKAKDQRAPYNVWQMIEDTERSK